MNRRRFLGLIGKAAVAVSVLPLVKAPAVPTIHHAPVDYKGAVGTTTHVMGTLHPDIRQGVLEYIFQSSELGQLSRTS